jgi:carbamate kinase
MQTIVIALGGNAIQQPGQRGTTEEQFANIDTTAAQIAKLARAGHRLVLTHGNGPQAGALLIQQEATQEQVPGQSLAACGAMTQGQIGWMIQNRLRFHLDREGLAIPVCSVVTQVLVNVDDPDFRDPSKPVGPFYTEQEAAELRTSRGWVVKHVKPGSPKGWRRVVPSPEPQGIVEAEVVVALLASGVLVVASGGGGIPVSRDNGSGLLGVNAVIDKDKAGFTLARAVGADGFLVLTDVEKVALDYGKPGQRFVDELTAAEAERYLAEGHFLRGSMGPKVEACTRFVRWSGKPASIGSLDRAAETLEGKSGTRIVP